MKNDIVIEQSFKVKARLLPQLGDMLIKSEDVAFLELVKNAYDADAENVIIKMSKIDSPSEGVISIQDDGIGMSLDIITNVWLVLASDYKTKQVKDSELTVKGRLPIGEKGIGRLGVHKLGNIIELISKKKDEKEVHVNINWTSFDEGGFLEHIPITVVEKQIPTHFKDEEQGTFIKISDFTGRSAWTRGKFRDIQRTITSFTSPFEETNENFKPIIEMEDNKDWLEDIVTWDEIKDYSIIEFNVEIQNNQISHFYYKYVPYSIFEKAKHRTIKYGYFKNKEGEFYFENDTSVENYKTLTNPSGEEIDITDLGKITFKGFIFNLEAFVIKDISDKKGLKKYLTDNSGVKVYRGTAPSTENKASYVRVYNYGERGNDWLGLNLKRINQPVSISNNLIVGGVFLDREESKKLQEKTDRQGFIEDNSFENFRDAINHCVAVLDIYRKADVKELRDLYGPKGGNEPIISTINKLKEIVEVKIKDIEIRSEINKHLDDIEKTYVTMQDILLKSASAGLSLGIVLHEIEKIIQELLHIVNTQSASATKELVQRLSKLVKGYADIFKKSNRRNVNPNDVIANALFSVEFRLKAHKVDIIDKYSESNSIVNMASSLIEGVLINIIDNSIYWLDIAHREYKKIEKKKIVIKVDETEKNVRITIADNGTGFTLATEQMIQPFVTGKKSGMGLGLHIVHEIIKSHNGRLEFPDYGDVGIPLEFKTGAIVRLVFPK